ncbi:helix-turn-helix domain-containing protein [Thiorhodovibrio litoralis]
MKTKLLLTYSEAAELLSLSVRSIERLVEKEELKRVYPTKRSARIITASIEEYVARLHGKEYNEGVGSAMRNPNAGETTWPNVTTKTVSTKGRTRLSGGGVLSTQGEKELDALLAPRNARKPRLC